MSHNILVTGAAGYIGGSVLDEFLSRSTGPIRDANLYAAVRGEDQAEAIRQLGVKVLQLDMTSDIAVEQAVRDNKISVIINTASSFDPAVVAHLIKALGQQRRSSGRTAIFIQTSVVNLFAAENDWPQGEVRDSDPLHALEKKLNLPNPLSATNLAVDDLGAEEGVKTFNIGLPLVYGRGTGAWRKLSVNIPAYVRASTQDRVVHKFDKDAAPTAIHISDLTALYALILENALQGESIPTGKAGYYFAIAHRAPQWEIMDRLAKNMHARGLVDSAEVQTWPSYELAAKKLEFPLMALESMTMCSGEQIAVNAHKLGWKPEWSQERFLDSIDDEVQAVLDLDTVKPTLFAALLNAGL